MKTVIIIPARFGSSRYEGKPLIKINKQNEVKIIDIKLQFK